VPHKNKRGQGHQIKQTNKQTKGTTDKPQAAHNAQRHTTHTLFRALSNDETSSGSAEHRLRSHSTTLVWPTDAASCNAFQPSLGRYASECPASAYVVSTRKSPSRAALRNAWPSGLGFGRDCCQCDTHAHNTPHVRGRHSHNNNKSKQNQKKKKKRKQINAPCELCLCVAGAGPCADTPWRSADDWKWPRPTPCG